jgi:ferritin-like metal-binding protein YciE/uncharacterized protein YrrD
METINELFQHELRDIYYAEYKLLDALDQLVQESTTPEIRAAFADHREQTRGHVDRLDSVFRIIGALPATAPCPGIEGLVKEKMLFAQQKPSSRLLDLYNLGAGIKSERYEISAYEGLINLARNLGMQDAIPLLEGNLREEQQALDRLHSLVQQFDMSGMLDATSLQQAWRNGMAVEVGARVRSSDGQDIGTVDRLIFDPGWNRVKAAVIRKGMLLQRAVEVPISAFRQTLDGGLSINLTADEVDNLPEFHEADYTAPPADYALPDGMTPGSLYWPAGTIMGPPRNIPLMGPDVVTRPDSDVESEVRSALSRQALENAVIGKGSTVTASDGKNVGKVEDMAFDATTGELTGLLVRSGLLAHKDQSIDPSLIADVDEGVVYLKVTADQLPTS